MHKPNISTPGDVQGWGLGAVTPDLHGGAVYNWKCKILIARGQDAPAHKSTNCETRLRGGTTAGGGNKFVFRPPFVAPSRVGVLPASPDLAGP